LLEKVILFGPEIYLFFIIFILFVESLAKSTKVNWLPYATFLGIFISIFSFKFNGVLFLGTYKIDFLSQFFKFLTYLGLTLCVLNSLKNKTLSQEIRAEYYLFMGLSSLGLLFLSSAVEIFTIYIALELTSYSLYVLVPLRNQDPRAVEGAVKYMFYGALATALGLYGVSYILASKHTTYLAILLQESWKWSEAGLAILGLGMFLLSFLYKLSLFPFHFWSPDLYEGSSNETATFAATMPKLGAMVVLIRLAALSPDFNLKLALGIMAALSMTFGNLLALVQRDVKRLLGYSTIAHAGFIILGLVAGTKLGLGAAAFYSFAYLVMNLAAFWVITLLSQKGENITLEDLKGLAQREPFLAFVLAAASFGLAGIPPTVGFSGKFFLLTSAWGHGFNWLVIIAALNTALAIFYYLNLVRLAYTKEPEENRLDISLNSRLVACLLGIAIVFFGLIPQNLLSFLIKAVNQLTP